ncbi:MAG TPA: DUF1501 domain-containing protein [Casimicrobiaceae bacterium]|jgi:uncharacterized protein (DUF1501 family)|nr:DUF1501 domain-containing protein [Casimicrobiaceae bacterium]
MKAIAIPRRAFLRQLGALSALGLASRLDLIRFAAEASAQTQPDYKALVCVFLFGGNDGNNTVIPLDAAGYGQYAAIRPATSGINLSQASLLPIQPIDSASPFGLHPSLTDLQMLFNQNRMAILANVGTLLQPTTQAQYAAGLRPLSLYSHADQQAQWQSAVSSAASGTGWGGRIADKVAPMNAASGFPVVTSLDGAVLFTSGASAIPLSIPVTGSFALSGYSGSTAAAARMNAVQQLLAQASGNALVDGASDIGAQALDLSATVNPILANANSTIAPLFTNLNTSTANQLYQVAKLIEARAATGAARQIFFVQLGSFDTHGDQLNRQQNLFEELSPALKAFYDATVALGVASQVTTFTLSDFGRTLQPASGGGTDHAWGSHHFIIGGAVQGGKIYGRYPQLSLGGPDDAEKEGRWLPSCSVDQYGATLARWFGVATTDLDSVFSNLASFSTADLGFMG